MQQAGGAYIPLKLDLTQFNSATATAIAGLKKIGIAAGAIYALQKAFSASTNAAIDFNRQLHNIWTLTDKTRGQMAQLGDEIRALSRRYDTLSSQSARALYQIYSSTFYGASGMKILEESTKGAAAGLSDVFSVADMLTTVLNAYRMSAEQASHINDLLFTTIKYGKTTMSELADQFGRLAGVAAPAGARVEEMTAAISTLTRQGIATDWAVTSLRQTIMQLLRPGKELKNVINDLGYASGRALIEHEGFAQAIKLVGDYAEQNGIRMEQLFSNVRAVTAVLPLATTAASSYAKDLERMANAAGAAEVAFKKQTESWSYQLAQAQTYIQDVGISIGKLLVPALVGAYKAFAAILTPLRDFAEAFSSIGGDYFVAIVGGITALTAAVWGLTKAFGALSAISTSLVKIPIIARLGALLGGGSVLTGAGIGLGGILATSIAVKAAVDFDFTLGNVTGMQKVVRALADSISMVAGGAVAGAIIGSLFGAGVAGLGIGAAVGASVALTILVIHEIRKSADIAAARMEAATQAVARARLPLEVGPVTMKGGGLRGLAEQIVAADKALDNTAANIEAVQSALEKYYVAETTWWGEIKGWHLKESLVPGLRALDEAQLSLEVLEKSFGDVSGAVDGATGEISNLDSSIAGLGETAQLTLPSVSALSKTVETGGLSFFPGETQPNYLQSFTPTLVSDWKKAQKTWADLTATLNDNTKSAEEIAKAYEDMGSMADFWESVANAIANSFPELSAEIEAQVEQWKSILGDEQALNPVIKAAEDFRANLSALKDGFLEAKDGSLEQAIALQGLQEALAQAKAYVASLEGAQIAADSSLLALIDDIESLGITADESADAVATFNTALANVSSTLGSVAAQIGATFSQLEKEALKATKLGEVANIVQGLIGGAANLKSTSEGLERIITGNFPDDLKQWARQWHDALQGSYPEPGKTYEEIQREQEQAAKKAAAAAKKAAREAAQAAKDAAQAAQDAFKKMFDIPALAGIQKGSWEEAAKVIVGFAQNRDKLYDMAGALDAVNGKRLNEADVIDLIISAQRQLISSLDNQIKIMQFAGEDASALEEMKTRIEELFDPLGALKKKIREILGISTTSPAVGGAQLRDLLLAIAKKGKIPKLATGGEVLTAGLAYLHPGETVTPATVNPLSGGVGMYSGLEGVVKAVAEGTSACANGMCALAQEAQKGMANTAEAVSKTASSTCNKITQSAQAQQKNLEDLSKMFQATVAGDAEALNKLLKAAKPGGDAWKLLMQAYKDHVSEIEGLIEDYKLLGLSTEELERGLNKFKAAVQGTTPLILQLRNVVGQIKDAFSDFVRNGIYEILKYLLGPLFGTLKKGTESLGSSLNVPTGYKVARAAWKAATPGEPGVLKGGGEEESLMDKLLTLFSTFLEKALQTIASGIGDWLVAAWDKIDWVAVGAAIVTAFGAVWSAIYTALEPVLGPVLAALTTSLSTLVAAFMAAGVVVGLFEGVIAITYGALQGLAEDLRAFFEPVLDAIGKAWERLQPVIEATKNLFAVFAPVFKAFGEIVAKGIEYMTDLFVALAPVIQILADIANAIMPALVAAIKVAAKVLEFVLTPVVNIVVSALNILASVLKVVGNAFIALYNFVLRPIINFGIFIINALADLFNGISNLVKTITLGLVDLGHIDRAGYIPALPYLQLGGEIIKEGLAYLHPNEFVIPTAQVEPLPAGIGSGGTIAIKNYLIVDGRVLAESTNRISRENDKLMTGSTIGGRAWRVA